MKFTAKGKPQREKSPEVGHFLLADKKTSIRFQIPTFQRKHQVLNMT
jgi:hypothetical protein